MEFNQLIEMENNQLTAEQRSFTELHSQIVYYGQMTAESLLWLSKNLSEMKNTELYREAGFESFEDYAEKGLNLKRRQAYNYARIYENLGESFVHSNAQIGVSKLALLSSMTEDERKEIESKTDLEKVSVSDLKKLKKQLTEKDEKIEKLDDEMNKYLEDDKVARDKATAEIERLQTELDSTQSVKDDLLEQLQTENAELKAKEQEEPTTEIVEKIVEKVVTVKDTAEIESLQKQLKTANSNNSKLTELETQVKTHTDHIATKQAEIDNLKKKLATSDTNMTKFKVKFTDLQNIGKEVMNLLAELPQESQTKCKSAISKVIEGWAL